MLPSKLAAEIRNEAVGLKAGTLAVVTAVLWGQLRQSGGDQGGSRRRSEERLHDALHEQAPDKFSALAWRFARWVL